MNQLVECGVDVDRPEIVVVILNTPIIQSGGRCNREEA